MQKKFLAWDDDGLVKKQYCDFSTQSCLKKGAQFSELKKNPEVLNDENKGK